MTNSIKLNKLLIIPFALMISFAVLFTGYFTWSYSESFALESSEKINQQTITSIETEIDFYFHHAAMENNALKRVISHDLLDIYNHTDTFQFMFEILQPELSEGIIDNIHIGYPNGDYLGVENSKEGVLKRVANEFNAHALQVIRLSDNNSIVAEKPNYYVQNTEWFKKAKASRKAVWSSVHPIFATNQLGMTLSEAVYDSEGKFSCVIGADFLLSNFNTHIKKLQPTDNAYLFIIDDKNNIIAQSGMEQYPVGKQLTTLENSNNSLLEQANKLVLEPHKSDTVSQVAEFNVNGVKEKYWISYKPYGYEQGVNWHIGVIIPESDLVGHVHTIEVRTFFVWLLAFVGTIIIGLLITNFINFSIQSLNQRVQKIRSTGNMFEHTDSRIEEVNQLSVAFSQISYELQELFLDLRSSHKKLEEIVEMRTGELKSANQELSRLITTENLTQLLNKDRFDTEINTRWDEFYLKESRQSISCLVIDVDDLVNTHADSCKHQAHYSYLQKVAKIIHQKVSQYNHTDTPAYSDYISGSSEQFFILLTNQSIIGLSQIVDDILNKIDAISLPDCLSTENTVIDISIGAGYIDKTMLSEREDTETLTGEDLVTQANNAVKQAKREGAREDGSRFVVAKLK